MTFIVKKYSFLKRQGGVFKFLVKVYSIVKNEGVSGLMFRYALSSRNNLNRAVANKEHAVIVNEESLTRFEKVMSGINAKGRGLEIGPSYNPIVLKSAGFDVEILDHATSAELRKKYRELGVPEDKINNIEDVDYLWSGEELDKLTGKSDYYDYIIASHVVEHTPDLIAFLSQCEKMLKSGGVLSLVVPDKRYCFDCLRPLSTTGDIMQSHYDKRIRHTPGAIFDHYSSIVFRNGLQAWHKDDATPLSYVHSVQEAMTVVEKSKSSSEYVDIHNWVFVPHSFRLVVHDLNSLGFINMSEESFFDTAGYEFFVSFKKDKMPMSIDRLEFAKVAIK